MILTRCAVVGVAVFACSCASAGTPQPPSQAVPDAPPASPPGGPARAAPPGTEARAASEPEPAPAQPAPLPARVDGGEIARSSLSAVLRAGVGRFLQRVEVEPHLKRGRFVGWRLVQLFPHTEGFRSGVLRRGDVVARVNGHSIERPEQFKNVWDSLWTASELVLEVRRRGRKSTVRYRIVQR